MFAVGAKKFLKFDVYCLFAEMRADLSWVLFLSHIRILTKETYTKKVMVLSASWYLHKHMFSNHLTFTVT